MNPFVFISSLLLCAQFSTVIADEQTLTDDFTYFNPNIWEFQCPGCVYSDGWLVVDGNDMLQRSLHPFLDMSSISATLEKDERCDDHALVISPRDHVTWTYSPAVDMMKFGWSCRKKVFVFVIFIFIF